MSYWTKTFTIGIYRTQFVFYERGLLELSVYMVDPNNRNREHFIGHIRFINGFAEYYLQSFEVETDWVRASNGELEALTTELYDAFIAKGVDAARE